jgi:AhpD family alkylhydroperoxidase
MTEVAQPRVSLLDAERAPLTVRSFFADGDPGPITASLAHVPELLQVALPFFARALAGVTVSARTAELVIVRASAVLGCTYCTLTHAAVALGAGVTPEQVRTLCDGARPARDAAVDEREAALLAWVDEVAGGRGEVPDAIAERMDACYDEATVVELLTMLTCTILLNRYCTSLRLPTGAGSLRTLTDAGLDPEELAS